MEPSKKWVSSSHRFEREQIILRNHTKIESLSNVIAFQNSKEINGVRPLCSIGNKGLYIDARGRLFPCCWVANRYNHNSEWQELSNHFNLKIRTLSDALTDKFWTGEFQSFKWQECQTKCAAGKVDEQYASEW